MTGEGYLLTPIGRVRGGRAAVEDDAWGAMESRIDLDPAQFGPAAMQGLDQFSHAEIVFVFDQVSPERIHTGARRPRGNPDWPEVGIFAQRGKDRPNRIGLTTCEILGVEGLTLHVRGLDAVDGSPVLDIKPYMSGFAPRGTVREPDWARAIMSKYW